MAKRERKINVKNDAKEMLLAMLTRVFTEEGMEVFDNEDFVSHLTASTLVVDVNGVDVKVVLTTPKGDATNLRYEREDGVDMPEASPSFVEEVIYNDTPEPKPEED
jgi:hypothetical protein